MQLIPYHFTAYVDTAVQSYVTIRVTHHVGAALYPSNIYMTYDEAALLYSSYQVMLKAAQEATLMVDYMLQSTQNVRIL